LNGTIEKREKKRKREKRSEGDKQD